MVVALLFLTAMTMVGTLFVVKTRTETQIAGHDTRFVQALFDAEAGYAEALARMTDPADTAYYIGPPVGDWQTNPGWGVYIVDAAGSSAGDPERAAAQTDGVDNDGDGAVDESGERYPELSTRQGSGRLDYPWVKVRYKRNDAGDVLLFGDHDANLLTAPVLNIVRGFPVLVVSAEGLRGTARRRVEVEAVKPPFEIPDAAVYSESDQFKFNGTAFLVSGEDHDPVTGAVIVGNPEAVGIATTGDPAAISGSLHTNQADNVLGEGAPPSVDRADVDLDLQGLRDHYVPRADMVLAPGTYSNESFGGLDDYRIVHATGDIHLSGGGVTGGGILIVDGDLEVTGQFTWYGLVLVLGDITFSGGGSGTHLFGSLLVQGTVEDQTIGGQADLFYSSEALTNLTAFTPYTIVNWRELP
jgi:hypothetical protein